jgi:anthranilate phosphoribosyltransferase
VAFSITICGGTDVGAVVSPLIAQLLRGEDLGADQIDAGLGSILAGGASEAEIAGLLVALRAKGESAAELAAMVRTMLRFATLVETAHDAIDTCGTGGDRAGTLNVSTIAALVAAGAGVRVVKHGNRAASSQCGSADVLQELGIPIDLGPDGVAHCVDAAGIGFCQAPRYHPAMRFVGPVRAALGVPTAFNFLGPLANPARVTRQCVGVSDPAMAERVLAVLIENGAYHVMVFCGADGLDELTTTSTSTIYEYHDGEHRRHDLDPTQFGIERVSIDDLRGGDAVRNADIVRSVLAGTRGPARDIVVLNAAAALIVGGHAAGFADGIATANDVIDTGRAANVLDTWLRVAQAAAARENT